MAKAENLQMPQGEVKEMRLQEALREALRYEMARDKRVFVIGEDVALFGGAYGVTRGLLQEFGDSRVRDTPISEAGMVGLAIGAAINGMRPIVELQFCDLLPLCMDQLTTHCIIAGSTGSGKSISAQVLVEEMLLKDIAVIVFDPTAQWSGMLRKLESPKMFAGYPLFGMRKGDARAFNGNVRAITNAREKIDLP